MDLFLFIYVCAMREGEGGGIIKNMNSCYISIQIAFTRVRMHCI